MFKLQLKCYIRGFAMGATIKKKKPSAEGLQTVLPCLHRICYSEAPSVTVFIVHALVT